MPYQLATPAVDSATRDEELPLVSEIRRYKQNPIDGRVYVLDQIVLREDDWRASPESDEGGWDVTRFGPIVIATKVTFLRGMRVQGANEGG